MTHLFNLILLTTLHGTIVGLAIVGIKALLNTRLNARWHYLLWVILLIKLVFPFGPESALSIFNVVPEIPVLEPPPAIVAPQNPAPIPVSPVSPSPPSIDTTLPASLSPMEIAAWIWITGAVILAGWLLGSLVFFGVRLKKTAETPPPRIPASVDRAKARMGVDREIGVIVSGTVATPSLFGLLKPSILLPDALGNLSDKDLEYVILHELAHLKRRDILVNYLLLFIQTLHWYNPVIWYLFRCVRRDMEAATDEAVLAIIETSEHKQYGMTLINILASFSEPRLATKLLCMADTKSDIVRRVKMIKMAGFFRKRRKLAFTLGALCIVLLSGLMLTSSISGSAPAELIFDQVAVLIPGESQPKLTLSSSDDLATIKQALDNRIMTSTEGLELPDYYLELYRGAENFDTVSLWLPLGEQAIIIFESNPQSIYMLSYLDTNLVASLVDPLEDDPGDQAPKAVDLTNVLHEVERISVIWGNLDGAVNVGNVLGHANVMKIERPEGTVNEILYFVFNNGRPELVTGFYGAGSWEVDVNGNGVREVVYTFASPGPNIRVIFADKVEVDLNSVFQAPSVIFVPESSQFIINYPYDDKDYIYRFVGPWELHKMN